MAKRKPSKADIPARPHSALNALSLKERAFVHAIATPGKPTFGNGTQSALASNNGKTPNSAGVSASLLLRKPKIESAIEEVFRKHHLDIEVRSGVLKDLMSREILEIEQKDEKGVVKGITSMPNDKIRLATIRELNRMDGTYARADAVGRAQGKVLDAVLDEYTRKLRAEIRAEISQDAPIAGRDGVVQAESTDEHATEGAEPTEAGQADKQGETSYHSDIEGAAQTGGGG